MAGPETETGLLFTKHGVLSTGVGEEWMDGRSILLNQPIKYVRPWNHLISFSKLSNDNLPPFYVRLHDDQVGHLTHFARGSRKTVHVSKLGKWWPWDFAPMTGHILLSRDNWGAAYTGPATYTEDRNLKGGPPLLEYVDPCLPLTYTSCDRIMPQGICGLRASAPKRREPQVAETKIMLTKKREAPEDMDEKSDIKKPRLDIKPIAAKPSSVDGPVSETKSRLFVDNVTAREALKFYEVRVESVRHSRDKIMQLETELT